MTRLDAWAERTNAIASALSRSGRDDLLPVVCALRDLLLSAKDSENADAHSDTVVAVVEQTLRAVKENLSGRTRGLDPSLLARVVEAHDAIDASQTTPEEKGWAEGVLNGFAEIDGAGLDSLLGSLKATKKLPQKDGLGTLREPLADGDKSRVLMKGELTAGLLADLIQLFAQNLESGCLVLEASDGTSASVYLKEGTIADAACGADVGEKAFFSAMSIQEGRFVYRRGVEPPCHRIQRSAQHLIMDTLRMMDEAS